MCPSCLFCTRAGASCALQAVFGVTMRLPFSLALPAPLNRSRLLQAVPLDTNILEFHYVIEGPPDSPYAGAESRRHARGFPENAFFAPLFPPVDACGWRRLRSLPACATAATGGWYHGILRFPSDYPMKVRSTASQLPAGGADCGSATFSHTGSRALFFSLSPHSRQAS